MRAVRANAQPAARRIASRLARNELELPGEDGWRVGPRERGPELAHERPEVEGGVADHGLRVDGEHAGGGAQDVVGIEVAVQHRDGDVVTRERDEVVERRRHEVGGPERVEVTAVLWPPCQGGRGVSANDRAQVGDPVDGRGAADAGEQAGSHQQRRARVESGVCQWRARVDPLEQHRPGPGILKRHQRGGAAGVGLEGDRLRDSLGVRETDLQHGGGPVCPRHGEHCAGVAAAESRSGGQGPPVEHSRQDFRRRAVPGGPGRLRQNTGGFEEASVHRISREDASPSVHGWWWRWPSIAFVPSPRLFAPRLRWAAAAVAFAVVASGGAYTETALQAPLAAAGATVQAYAPPVIEAPEVPAPRVGASGIAAIGFDGVLASSGPEGPLPIASISKIVSALVVLERMPLAAGEQGPSITLTDADVALYGKYQRVGGKVESVAAGVVMSQREVLEVMLVSSANNYAESLAGWSFGSQGAFVDAAAVWLAENGFDSTVLVEPTGMSPRNVSTVDDLLGIAQVALAHPVIAEIVASTSVDVPHIGRIDNTNTLLGVDSIDGIKTGTLDEAGSCLLFSADYPVGSSSVTVVGVVLGSESRESLEIASRSLFGAAADGFSEVTLAGDGEAFASYATEWGESAQAVAEGSASVVVWSDTSISGVVDAAPLVTAALGEAVGEVAFTIGDGREITVPLVLDSALAEPGAWWRIWHPFESLSGIDWALR